MGKRILPQRRGKGAPQFRSAKKGKVAPAKYPVMEPNETRTYEVKDIIHERGRHAPIAVLESDKGETVYVIAARGLEVGQSVVIGPQAPVRDGNVLPLGQLPEGTMIFNIEKVFNDGGKFVRAAGTYAIVMGHEGEFTSIKMPSGKKVLIPSTSRATVGIAAGGGASEKPFLKAGRKLRYMRARGRKWPLVRGVAMAAVYHPHGGGRHQHPGKPTTVARNTPPGRKVGHIAARKTGRGK
ncbi:MAG: 50S ribosomal protein L2 [Nitrososphaeria archaeon]